MVYMKGVMNKLMLTLCVGLVSSKNSADPTTRAIQQHFPLTSGNETSPLVPVVAGVVGLMSVMAAVTTLCCCERKKRSVESNDTTPNQTDEETRDPEGVATSPTREPEGVTTTPPREPEGLATTSTRYPEGVTTTPSRDPEGLATTSTRDPEGVATSPTRDPEGVATSPTRDPEGVATSLSAASDAEEGHPWKSSCTDVTVYVGNGSPGVGDYDRVTFTRVLQTTTTQAGNVKKSSHAYSHITMCDRNSHGKLKFQECQDYDHVKFTTASSSSAAADDQTHVYVVSEPLVGHRLAKEVAEEDGTEIHESTL
ncbi:uncharacterized protein LOC124112381 isoform X1 [Haliotis rufescens]|uniref:uncharacterized protein LOC124112381 isoform X1 n=2 Tax=Haliotis rufescens TaxID=6454 RepID=UPI00201E8B07|nr:uncharacterized protein LOC124112381 isoform X1 [Haliotis rufescens]